MEMSSITQTDGEFTTVTLCVYVGDGAQIRSTLTGDRIRDYKNERGRLFQAIRGNTVIEEFHVPVNVPYSVDWSTAE